MGERTKEATNEGTKERRNERSRWLTHSHSLTVTHSQSLTHSHSLTVSQAVSQSVSQSLTHSLRVGQWVGWLWVGCPCWGSCNHMADVYLDAQFNTQTVIQTGHPDRTTNSYRNGRNGINADASSNDVGFTDPMMKCQLTSTQLSQPHSQPASAR